VKCLAAALLAIVAVVSHAKANDCAEFFPGFHQLFRPDQPRGVATAWLPQFERLLSATPVLSPREERWLDGELGSGDSNRVMRALASIEMKQRSVRQNAERLVHTTHQILSARDRVQEARWWLRLQNELLIGSNENIVALVNERRIGRAALPDLWQGGQMQGSDFVMWLTTARAFLAADIAQCTLPAVLGLPLPGTPGFDR
jgi:hypothetical protein